MDCRHIILSKYCIAFYCQNQARPDLRHISATRWQAKIDARKLATDTCTPGHCSCLLMDGRIVDEWFDRLDNRQSLISLGMIFSIVYSYVRVKQVTACVKHLSRNPSVSYLYGRDDDASNRVLPQERMMFSTVLTTTATKHYITVNVPGGK